MVEKKGRIKSYIPLIYVLIDFLDPICVQSWLLILKRVTFVNKVDRNKNKKSSGEKSYVVHLFRHCLFIVFVLGSIFFRTSSSACYCCFILVALIFLVNVCNLCVALAVTAREYYVSSLSHRYSDCLYVQNAR